MELAIHVGVGEPNVCRLQHRRHRPLHQAKRINVRDQVAGTRADPKAMTAEARGQHETRNFADLADPRHTVWRRIDVAGPGARDRTTA